MCIMYNLYCIVGVVGRHVRGAMEKGKQEQKGKENGNLVYAPIAV